MSQLVSHCQLTAIAKELLMRPDSAIIEFFQRCIFREGFIDIPSYR